jgi:threonine/homoserine/homoserine lactone efflux protein
LLLTLVAFGQPSTWAFAGNLFRPWLQRYYRLFNGLMAALLIYTAIASLFPH